MKSDSLATRSKNGDESKNSCNGSTIMTELTHLVSVHEQSTFNDTGKDGQN